MASPKRTNGATYTAPVVSRRPARPEELDWTTLGASIRAARLSAGLGLRELARRIEMTPGFVSQLENGIAGPSVATLYAVARELDVSIDSFFRSPEPVREHAVDVVRAGDRATMHLNRGVKWQMLASDPSGGGEFREITYAPGSQSSAPGELLRHQGLEYGVVLSGTLGVEVEGREFLLQRGDSISYDAALGHRFWNPGDRAVRALWLIYGHPAAGGPATRAFTHCAVPDPA